ncbi:MAG: M1 family metallopeptidase [Pyrinomonadaceae bacterium]
MRNRFAFVFTAATIVFAAFSGTAQKPRPDFNRYSDFDVQHYTIRARFDRAKKEVFGDTTVSFKPTKADFRSIELDAIGLNFTSVKLDPSGQNLQYRTTSTKVIVTLDKPYQPADTVAIRFVYTTTDPKKGVYFRAAENSANGEIGHSAQIWSQGEAEEARYWFPGFDFPSDKATTEEYITAQGDEAVVGNGEFLGKDANNDGTVTWHYKMPVPHSTYLVSFVIGKYTRIEDKYKDTPLGYYVYPGTEGVGKKVFGDTPDMIRVYEQLTGVNFPYNKYDQTIVAQFQFGGMENITATTMNDSEILSGFTGITVDLVSHELAHSWFGDMVTCRNWAELWLNEGFATYMEAAYREQRFGRESYMAKISEDAGSFLGGDVENKVQHKPRHPLFDLNARNVDALFDDPNTTYNKAGAVLHQLREQVGTEAFWKGLNIYLNAHRFANVETSDLRKAMEQSSGQDLGWWFNEWVYSGGSPSLNVTQLWHPRTKTLTVTVTQIQPPDAITPAVFRLPMDVRITTAGGDQTEKMDLTRRVQVFTYKAADRPSKLEIDPEDKIPVKTVKVHPIAMARAAGE